MMTILLLALLVGAVLGQRFKVLVLLPAMALALGLTAADGLAQAEPFWQVLVTAVVAFTGLQLGYLAGTGIRHLMVAAHPGRIHGNSLPVPARRAAR